MTLSDPNPYRRRVTDHASAAHRDWWLVLQAVDQLRTIAPRLLEGDRADLRSRLAALEYELSL